MKKTIASVLLPAVFAIGTAGCASLPVKSATVAPASGGATFKPLGKDEKAKIKVLFFNEQAFSLMYGTAFNAKFPNVDIEVVSSTPIYMSGKDQKEELAKLIDSEKPDVLFLMSDQYEQFSAEGKLLELDPIVKKDKFDIDNLLPSVTELLKAKGGGRLNGLAPSFSGQALFYNKELFDRFGVPYPKDRMTWDEVMQLAKRFPTGGDGDSRVYGFASSGYQYGPGGGYLELMNNIGMTQGLRLLDPETMTMKLRTEPWKKVLQAVVDAYQSGAVQTPAEPVFDASKPETLFTQNPFIGGKAAMTVSGYHLINAMDEAQKNVKTLKPVQWDVVTEPVDRNTPDVATGFALTQIVSIHAESAAPGAAWELVKYANGDELAKSRSKSSFELMTRKAYMKEKDGRSLESFYKLKPSDRAFSGYSKVPFTFFASLNGIANEEIKAAIERKKSVDEALGAMEEKAQKELSKVKLKQDEAAEKGQQK